MVANSLGAVRGLPLPTFADHVSFSGFALDPWGSAVTVLAGMAGAQLGGWLLTGLPRRRAILLFATLTPTTAARPVRQRLPGIGGGGSSCWGSPWSSIPPSRAGFRWPWPSMSPMAAGVPARYGERALERDLAVGAPRAVRHRRRAGAGPQPARHRPPRRIRRLLSVHGRADGCPRLETPIRVPFHADSQSCGAAPQNPQFVRESRKSVRLPRARHRASDSMRNVQSIAAGAPHSTKTRFPTSSKRDRRIYVERKLRGINIPLEFSSA